jgi:chaperonin cofactor prefoldin
LTKFTIGLKGLRRNIILFIAGLKRIEDKLDREISKRELIEREIAALRERVSKLQERIEDIDSQLKSHQHSQS